jgi:lipid A disaccharide synthetase
VDREARAMTSTSHITPEDGKNIKVNKLLLLEGTRPFEVALKINKLIEAHNALVDRVEEINSNIPLMTPIHTGRTNRGEEK